jgi:DNA gyrase/topoisomerase IV subunit A
VTVLDEDNYLHEPQGDSLTQHLLVVTEGGYGKRVKVDEIRRTNRGTQGVRVSKKPVAIAIVVEATDTDSDLLISTTSGKVQRISIADVPIKARTYSTNGPRGIPTGARIIRLRDGDRVASGMLSNGSGATGPSNSPVTDAVAMGPHIRAEMGVALHDGESIGDICVLLSS